MSKNKKRKRAAPVAFGSESIGPEFIGFARPELASVEVDGEMVLYDDDERRFHRLNPAATTLWVCLDGTGSLAEIATDIAAVYGTDSKSVLADVIRLARQLADEGLLVGVESKPDSAGKP